MLTNFFQKKDMERVIWLMLQSYKNIFTDSQYNNGLRDQGSILLEAGILGALLYSNERKISTNNFYELLMQRIDEYAVKNGEISIEVMCYLAAALRGDFQKNISHLGGFFGQSARKLGLKVDVFEKHQIPSGSELRDVGKMIFFRYLSAANKI